jgi:phospholipid/cholesterol/gamma-HCH transport system permease protein
MGVDQRQKGPFRGPTGWIEEIGFGALALGSCLALYARILLGRARLDMPAFSASLRQAGLSILPAITLVSASVGLILGHQIDAILTQLDLPGLVLLTVIYATVMELIPILVGILVAGRAGVALAVRQATLTVTGEMDGLLVNGIHPVQFTTGPVLLSMLIMSFAFVVWGTIVTFAAAGVWLWGVTGISPAMFLEALTVALSVGALVEALVKPLLFALLIALIATVNGTGAGRNPEGIARAATRTMIGAVTAILVTDLLYILFLRV